MSGVVDFTDAIRCETCGREGWLQADELGQMRARYPCSCVRPSDPEAGSAVEDQPAAQGSGYWHGYVDALVDEADWQQESAEQIARSRRIERGQAAGPKAGAESEARADDQVGDRHPSSPTAAAEQQMSRTRRQTGR